MSQVLSATEPAHRGSTRQDSWFNRQCSFLTYPFKVLDVAQMLLIQANPTKKQAEEGFARENAAGIDLRASERNYKRDSDKPEVAVALTEFWMLHGFRSLEQIAEIGARDAPPQARKSDDFRSADSNNSTKWTVFFFAQLRQGRSDQGSSPCSTQPRTLSQTPPSSRYSHRLLRLPGAGSSSQTADRRACRST